jgi:hypothetical protein
VQAIMHLNAMDIAFEIKSILYEDENTMQVMGNWICLGYTGNPWPVASPEVLTITRKHDWVWISEEILKRPRTKSGIPT